MGIALGIIGMLATIAGIVLLIIALVKKRGWGVARSVAVLGVGIILFFVGVFTSLTSEAVSPTGPSETLPPASEVGEVGKSRLNPVPFGSSLAYGDQRVTVLSSQRLTQMGWDTPKEGSIYLVVKLRVDFLGDPSKIHRLYEWDFDVVGDHGCIYKYEWLVDTDTPLKTGEFYSGATTSGDLVYEIDRSDANLVLIWHCGLVSDRFLEIP